MFDMFGFKRQTGPREVPAELTEIRDCLAEMVGTTADLYTATMIDYLTRHAGKTEKDVKRERTRMISYLRKYVRSEILLERALNGGEVALEDLEKLRV